MNRVIKTGMVALVLCLGFGLIINGCAQQKPTAELQQAEAALAKAKDAGAQDKASSQYSSAESKLAEAKKLMDEGQYKKAKQLLEEATQQAKMAEQTAIAASKPKIAVSATKEAAPAAAPETKWTKDMNQADNHVVVKGECLWKISGTKAIYDDPFQWPLIYQANKDKIKNPDRIYPKQNFKIGRDASTDELKAARKKAGAGAPYWPPGPNDYAKHHKAKAVKKAAPKKEAPAAAAPAPAPAPAAAPAPAPAPAPAAAPAPAPAPAPAAPKSQPK